MCSSLQEERDRLREEKAVLEVELKTVKTDLHWANRSYTDCIAEKDILLDRVASAEYYIEQLENDVSYYEGLYNGVLKRLEKAIEIPDVSAHVETRELIEPYQHEGFAGISLLCADFEYYAFPLHQWELMLAPVQEIIDHRWVPDIGDCDNFAYEMGAFLGRAFRETGFLDKQGAFGIAWSITHAYNIFVTPGDIYIYEPQSGTYKGTLSNPYSDDYKSYKAWFPF
jgi:hypothetical protein